MKKRLFSNLVLAFILTVVVLPVQANADVTSSASANLSVPFFTALDAAGAPVTIIWTDATGADMRGSLSGVSTTLNGDAEPYNADYADGLPWQNTYVTFTQGTVPNTVTGSADTHSSLTSALSGTVLPADRLFASSALALGTPLTTGSIFAQAFLGGQFTVPTAATLNVTLTYSLLLDLFSSGGIFNYADAIAALYLYDFDALDPNDPTLSLLYTSSVFTLSQLINGDGSYNNSVLNQTLTLTWLLDPTVLYDFEASATVHADAAVPEPISLVLLGGGMIGLAILRKRFA